MSPELTRLLSGRCESTERLIDEMVKAHTNFNPTKEVPSPSVKTNEKRDDLLAVLAGSKPATFLDAEELEEDLLTVRCLERARREGLRVEEAILFGRRNYVVGRDQNIERVIHVFSLHQGSEVRLSEQEHRELGEALGYPREAIDDFVNRVRFTH